MRGWDRKLIPCGQLTGSEGKLDFLPPVWGGSFCGLERTRGGRGVEEKKGPGEEVGVKGGGAERERERMDSRRGGARRDQKDHNRPEARG